MAGRSEQEGWGWGLGTRPDGAREGGAGLSGGSQLIQESGSRLAGSVWVHRGE